jgi:peptidoglycan/LPS O-acetylase OafA/YrhL
MAAPWIAGAAVRQRHAAGLPSGRAACLAAVAPLPVWIGYEAACLVWGRPFGLIPGVRAEIVQDWLIGLLFAWHLLTVPALLARLPPCPPSLARAIRAASASSFTIYLLHYPIMLLLRGLMLRFAPAWPPALLLPATLMLCLAVAPWTEGQKRPWRRALERLWPARAATA